MRWRWVTIAVTLAAFALSIFGMSFVQQQFFPSSDRNELIVDWNLPQNSSIAETNAQMAQFEQEALKGNAGIDHWSTYVGQGAPRFVLSFDVQPPDVSFGQMVIVTKSLEVRDRLKRRVAGLSEEDLPRHRRLREAARISVRRSAGRCSTASAVRTSARSAHFAQQLAGVVAGNAHLGNVVFDWMEPARVVKVDVLQDKARQLGVTSEDIASTPQQHRRRRLDHAGARRHLSRQGARPRQRCGARLDRNAAQSATVRQQRSVRAARGGGASSTTNWNSRRSGAGRGCRPSP